MPDPIDELQSFPTEGLPVNPLPASEVRRRGDRMRRRNTALMTVGSVAAAVVLVAVPFAVANRGADSDSAPDPVPAITQPSTVAWLQAIPPGFDLGALPADAHFRFLTSDEPGIDDFHPCGVRAFSTSANDPAPAVDTAGATYTEPGTESMAGRTLALYRDDAEAQAALEKLREGVLGCPEDANGRGVTLVNRIEDSSLPADDSFVYSQRAQADQDLYSDLWVFQVARVGNALYLAAEAGSAASDDVVAFEVQRLAHLSAPVLSDLNATFSENAVEAGTG